MQINKIKIISLLSLVLNINSMEKNIFIKKNINCYDIESVEKNINFYDIESIEKNIKDYISYLKEIERIKDFYKKSIILIYGPETLEKKEELTLIIQQIFFRFSEIETTFNSNLNVNNNFQKKIINSNFEERSSKLKKIINKHLKDTMENKEKIIKILTKKLNPKEEGIEELTPAQIKRRKKKAKQEQDLKNNTSIAASELHDVVPIEKNEEDIAINIFSKNNNYKSYSNEKSRSNSKFNKNKYNQLLRSNSLKNLKLPLKSELFKTDNNK